MLKSPNWSGYHPFTETELRKCDEMYQTRTMQSDEWKLLTSGQNSERVWSEFIFRAFRPWQCCTATVRHSPVHCQSAGLCLENICRLSSSCAKPVSLATAAWEMKDEEQERERGCAVEWESKTSLLGQTNLRASALAWMSANVIAFTVLLDKLLLPPKINPLNPPLSHLQVFGVWDRVESTGMVTKGGSLWYLVPRVDGANFQCHVWKLQSGHTTYSVINISVCACFNIYLITETPH